jgi:DNA end-binding protein Ku
MPPRASWTGYLRLSLVAIPVRLYNAVTSTSKVSLHQLHKGCHQRVRQQLICPEHGALEREDIVKGYEYEKDKYVVIDEEDLAKVKLETTKTIELVQFVDAGELSPIFLNTAYYVAPEGPVAEEGFRVIREAMRQANKVGIGRVVMSGKEQIVALGVEDKGFVLNTLQYAAEVRNPEAYFGEIQNGEVNKDQLSLAKQLVENSTVTFDPTQFKDRYQEALMEIIKAKIEGSEPVLVQSTDGGKVVNLMDALRQSVAQSKPQAREDLKAGKKPPAESVKAEGRSKKKKKGA